MDIIISNDAYKTDGAPLLLLAGPGTGKTWQLAKRIQHLTGELGVSPDEIAVITFTAEAAASMRAKLERQGEEYVEPAKRPHRISTMHSFGHRIIQENLPLTDLAEGFTVVTAPDTTRMLFNDAALLVGATLDDAIQASRDRTQAHTTPTGLSIAINTQYEALLRACNAIDYDDQIALACKILRDHEDVRRGYAAGARYLLVDEYQDINAAQFELIELLTRDARDGLFVVGDDDQSIYGFRGGSPEYIRHFDEAFPSCVVMQMRTSRRCLKNILDCAVQVVAANDTERIDKGQYDYVKPDSGRVYLHDCPSGAREAELVAYTIKTDMQAFRDSGGEKREAFVLVPSKLYVPPLQAALKEMSIETSFDAPDEDPWITLLDIRNWLNDQSNLHTRICAEAVIKGGATSIPTARSSRRDLRLENLRQVASWWTPVLQGRATFAEAMAGDISETGVTVKAALAELRVAAEHGAGKFLETFVRLTRPWSSTEKFFDSLKRLMANTSGIPATGYRVRILTMQKAKGLEAECVCVVGLEDGSMPRLGEASPQSEQARLLFVAMTRAKEELHLFHSRTRQASVTFRENSFNLQRSRFLNNLPEGQYETPYHPARGSRRTARTATR